MKRSTQQSGQALVAAALGLVVLLGAAGLAIDMGYLRYQKRLQQSAADSAALAGAAQIKFGGVTAAAHEDSLLNGFADGVNNTTVTVNNPPATGPHAGPGNGNYVEVLVTVSQPTFFMRIFGVNSATVTARSVAELGSARNVIYSLGSGAPGISSSGTLNAAGGIIGNEDLSNTGVINATSIGVVGTASGAATNPPVVTGIAPAGDPLSFMTPPGAGGGCQSGVVNDTTLPLGLNPYPLNPGRACPGGISISGARNVILNPGTYVVTNGGISFNGTGTITGAGVLLYLSAAGGAVTINTAGGNQTVNLIARTNGTRPGILFYQNPGNTSAAVIVQGPPASKFQGAFYFPNAPLSLTNTGNNAAYTIAVAKSLTLSGAQFPADYSSLPTGSPIKDAVLVE